MGTQLECTHLNFIKNCQNLLAFTNGYKFLLQFQLPHAALLLWPCYSWLRWCFNSRLSVCSFIVSKKTQNVTNGLSWNFGNRQSVDL